MSDLNLTNAIKESLTSTKSGGMQSLEGSGGMQMLRYSTEEGSNTTTMLTIQSGSTKMYSSTTTNVIPTGTKTYSLTMLPGGSAMQPLGVAE